MGLTIHYAARLKDLDLLPQFVTEVEDICNTLGWKNRRVDDIFEMEDKNYTFDPPLYDSQNVHLQGIMFTPPECETAFFVFLKSRWTCSHINLMCASEYAKIEKHEEFKDLPKLTYMIHTKTQYAGPDTHVALVSLFKYLEKKYFSEMHVSDEGDYWNTLDKNVLQQHFDEYTELINSVKGALENENWEVTDNPFQLADKIEEILKKRFSGLE